MLLFCLDQWYLGERETESTDSQTQAEKEVQVIKPLPKSSNFS